jgi:RHS repeat-associated protein
MTAVNGGVVWAAKYTSFGEADIEDDSILENNLRFAGQYYDGETGLHYNYHRFYDPEIGRYFTVDPIGLAGGINVFFYSLGNPLKFIDPKGLQCGPGTFGDWYIPDFIFGECCMNHDRCYEGNSSYNCDTPKSTCDKDACDCFKLKCIQQKSKTEKGWEDGPKVGLPPDIEFDACVLSAAAYCRAVSTSKKSQEQFDKARKNNGCCY